MKKSLLSVCLAGAVALASVACQSPSQGQNASTVSSEKKAVSSENATGNKSLKIMTSFYPMYDFTKKIVGDKAEVVNLVSPGMEAHDWEPSPNDIKNIQTADAVVYHGKGMEAWVEKVKGSMEEQQHPQWIEASDDIEGIPFKEKEQESDHDEDHHDEHEDHDHEHDKEQHEDHDDHDHDDHDDHNHDDHHDDHDHDKDHHEEGHHHHHHHGDTDPHMWLSPRLAKQEMHNIYVKLAELAPQYREEFKANYEKYAAEFDALDQEFVTALKPAKQRTLMTSHTAFAYLCAAYDLQQQGISGLEPNDEPSPSKMAELIEFAKKEKITTIFFEENVSPKVAETLAKEVGAKTAVLSPLESLSEEELQAGADYFSVMRQNLKALKEALLS